MGPRLATTNWARIENLNIPSKGALAVKPAAPRLVKVATKTVAAPTKPVTLWTNRVAA